MRLNPVVLTLGCISHPEIDMIEDMGWRNHITSTCRLNFNEYGSLREIWFDGYKGEHAPNMSCYFTDWFSMVKELHCSINIFSDAGSDVRWVGNWDGFAGSTG
ncbi:hypothetical protein M0R45_037937 [Rubus argutus]|uniref:S-protein homolog n=1 Tax=Rubus argutus TaxID=59490 RepID=A0AAW1W114_RUBAR